MQFSFSPSELHHITGISEYISTNTILYRV